MLCKQGLHDIAGSNRLVDRCRMCRNAYERARTAKRAATRVPATRYIPLSLVKPHLDAWVERNPLTVLDHDARDHDRNPLTNLFELAGLSRHTLWAYENTGWSGRAYFNAVDRLFCAAHCNEVWYTDSELNAYYERVM